MIKVSLQAGSLFSLSLSFFLGHSVVARVTPPGSPFCIMFICFQIFAR